jgi:hypothetical protein
LKKATQLALIWDAAADEPPPDDAEGAADEGAAAGELAGPLALALALADALEPDDEPPLLPQAATVTASTASAARGNTLTGRIRI